MKYCTKCGMEVNGDMQFCPKCGAKIQTPGAVPGITNLTERIKSKPLSIYRILLIIVGCINAGLIILSIFNAGIEFLIPVVLSTIPLIAFVVCEYLGKSHSIALCISIIEIIWLILTSKSTTTEFIKDGPIIWILNILMIIQIIVCILAMKLDKK